MATISSNSVCFPIASYSDYMKYGQMGCGNPFIAVLFFLSYHIILSMMLMTMFVAVVLDAYKEAYQREVSAVTDSHLGAILELWGEFDLEATRFITYRDFWTFAAKIARVYGLTDAQIRSKKGKKEFLDNLKAKIYEDTNTSQLCYEFHNVVECLLRVTM